MDTWWCAWEQRSGTASIPTQKDPLYPFLHSSFHSFLGTHSRMDKAWLKLSIHVCTMLKERKENCRAYYSNQLIHPNDNLAQHVFIFFFCFLSLISYSHIHYIIWLFSAAFIIFRLSFFASLPLSSRKLPSNGLLPLQQSLLKDMKVNGSSTGCLCRAQFLCVYEFLCVGGCFFWHYDGWWT